MALNQDLMTHDNTVSITGNDIFTKLKNEIAYWDEYMSELQELVRWYEDLAEFGKTNCTIHHDLKTLDKVPDAPEENKDRLVWSFFRQYANCIEAELRLGNCYFIRPNGIPMFQIGSLMDMICSGTDVRCEADLFTCEEPSEALEQLKSSEDYPDGFCKVYSRGAESYYESSLGELTECEVGEPDPYDCDCSECTCDDCKERTTDPDQAIHEYLCDENVHGDIVLDCSSCENNPECPPDCPVTFHHEEDEEAPCVKEQEKELRHVQDSSEVNVKDVLDNLQRLCDTVGVCNAIMKHIFNNHKDEFLNDFGQVVD